MKKENRKIKLTSNNKFIEKLRGSENFGDFQMQDVWKTIKEKCKWSMENTMQSLRRHCFSKMYQPYTKVPPSRLVGFSFADEYMSEILTTAHKLMSGGLKLDGDWIGSMMLAELVEDYKSMTVGIQGSGTKTQLN